MTVFVESKLLNERRADNEKNAAYRPERVLKLPPSSNQRAMRA
jgi:hypothetical protein